MRTIFRRLKPSMLAAMAIAMLGSAVLAQGSAATDQAGASGTPSASTPATGATPAASAPARQRGHRFGGPHAAWWGSKVTPGWAMMSWAERNEHREKMRSFKTYDDCKAYRDQHHEAMVARAKEKGREPLAQPRRDACARLKP